MRTMIFVFAALTLLAHNMNSVLFWPAAYFTVVSLILGCFQVGTGPIPKDD